MWKTYLFIVIPMMRGIFITAIVLIASGIIKVYDLVVAQTGGGPAFPPKFRPNTSMTPCSCRRTSARALPPPP